MARTYTNIIATLNFSLESFCKRLIYMPPQGLINFDPDLRPV